MELLWYILIILASSVIVWKGGSLLESSAESLSLHYKLSPIVHGSIVTAIGSSFPEFSTTIISTVIHGKFELGVAAIIGSAIFNILVIPGISVFFTRDLKTDMRFIFKDIQFYLTSVAVLMLIFSLAVIYHPVKDEAFKGEITREYALIPVLLYLFYLVLQRDERNRYNKSESEGEENNGKISKIWTKFLFSLVLIVISVEGLVSGAIFLGDYFNTPSFIWGVLIIAAATSVPDAIVSIREVIHGKNMTSLANVVGSNIFDLLIAIPAGVLIAGSTVVNFKVATPLMVFLGIATIIMVLLLLNKKRLTRKGGITLLFIYLIFIIWMILESFDLLNIVG